MILQKSLCSSISVLGCLTLTRRNDRRPGKCCFTTLQELFPFPKKWVYKTSESLIKTWYEQLNYARGTLVQIPLFPLSLLSASSLWANLGAWQPNVPDDNAGYFLHFCFHCIWCNTYTRLFIMTGKKKIDVIPQTIPDDDWAVRSSCPETAVRWSKRERLSGQCSASIH